jgi:predicted phage-related endonuclease
MGKTDLETITEKFIKSNSNLAFEISSLKLEKNKIKNQLEFEIKKNLGQVAGFEVSRWQINLLNRIQKKLIDEHGYTRKSPLNCDINKLRDYMKSYVKENTDHDS